MKHCKVIGQNISWYRRQKGLRQLDVSEATGINYRYYQDIEAGKKNLTLQTLKKICDFLEVSLDDIVNFCRLNISHDLEDFIKLNKNRLDNLSDEISISIRDRNRNFKYANKVFLNINKTTIDQVINQPVDKYLTNSSEEVVNSILKKHEKGLTCTQLIVTLKREGKKDLFNVYVYPVSLIFENKVVGVLGAFVEVEKHDKNYFAELQDKLINAFL
ncbi:MAG: helix-turn-helix transcriptional regulator [Bdellovibrionales bacterium]|nr:helix-turn-helix transcriptional regulator [Bdellovibrionales bacterium]